MNWQPIETAPKDGTSILVALKFQNGDDWGCDIVWWSDYTEFWESAGYDWPKTPRDVHDEIITHWMPLPAPPEDVK